MKTKPVSLRDFCALSVLFYSAVGIICTNNTFIFIRVLLSVQLYLVKVKAKISVFIENIKSTADTDVMIVVKSLRIIIAFKYTEGFIRDSLWTTFTL